MFKSPKIVRIKSKVFPTLGFSVLCSRFRSRFPFSVSRVFRLASHSSVQCEVLVSFVKLLSGVIFLMNAHAYRPNSTTHCV